MVLKHNFSEIGAYTDPMSGMMIFLNMDHHAIFYAILTMIFFISFYVFIRKTQDIGKSFLLSLFMNIITGFVLFYWGLKLGEIFIPELVILTQIVIFSIGIVGLYYVRNEGL